MLQTIDTIIALFENNLPMRFGVILYSAKLVEGIEANDGELPVARLKYDEDISSLVSGVFSLQSNKNVCVFLFFSYMSPTLQ